MGEGLKRAQKAAKATRVEAQQPMGWTISCSLARNGGFHVQARTNDQLNSFAAVVPINAIIHRRKLNSLDMFSLVLGSGEVTMNVVGKIAYEGDWPNHPNWVVS